jgi:type II secretory pathway component GspD/PulD (secretin)
MARTQVWRVSALLASGVALLLGILPASAQAPALPPPSGNNSSSPAVGTSAPGSDPKALANSKLLQARAQLSQGNFDAAEALAQEVARMNLSYRPGEDTPARVFKDAASARTDAATLLRAARSALARKQFDQAEKYARQADKLSSIWTFPVWGDSPSRALKDIAAARKQAAAASPQRPAGVANAADKSQQSPPPPPPAKAPPARMDTEKARALLKQGREALNKGQLEEAKKLLAQARSVKASLGWWEDNPERLEADIRKIEQARKPAAKPVQETAANANAKPPAGSLVPRTKQEAKALLAQGRKELETGKLDEAARTAQRVKALTSASWGLFEDSPDRLQIDIEKARVKRDREESVRVLAEARKLYEKGDYDSATRLAYKAQKLHGSYSIWDLGDRPTRLLADIQDARAKSRRTALPPPVVAKNTNPSGPNNGPGASPTGRTDTALASRTPAPTGGSLPTGVSPAAAAAAQAPNKLRAQQLVAEAQRLQAEGKLVEARQKALEAQRIGVIFSADEVTPELVYQQIALQVRQRIDSLVRQAHDTATYGKGDPQPRYREAETRLNEARQLACSFGLDTQPVDAQLVELRTLQSKTSAGDHLVMEGGKEVSPGKSWTNPAVVTTTTTAPSSIGQTLLEKARLELRRGDTSTARRMTESAMTSDAAVKDEAVALLRTIDAEEFNQKRLHTERAFDAALSAYNRREYAQANAMLAVLDVQLLDTNRSARLREISMTPEMVAVSARSPAAAKQATAQAAPAEGIIRTGATTVVPGTAKATDIGHARATDGPQRGGPARAPAAPAADGGLLDKHKAMQKILVEKLRQEGLDAQRSASEKFRSGQTEDALETLQSYLERLNEEKLEPGQLSQLRRPVESRLNQFRLLKAQKDLAAGAHASRIHGQERVDASRRAEEMKRKNVDKLMKDFNVLFKEGKYLEAESLAMRAAELDPDNGVASAAVYMARRQRAATEYKNIKEGREQFTLQALDDAEKMGPASAIDDDVAYDKDRWGRAAKRKPLSPIVLDRLNDREKAIKRRLSTPVSISFEGQSLKEVLDQLSRTQAINIKVDEPALQEQGISIDSQISIKLDQVSLKSALNLILHDVHLTHVIKDEVLYITTETQAKGKLVTTTYQVADLVIPVENFGDVRTPPPPFYQPSGSGIATPPTPATPGPFSLGGGAGVGSPSGSSGGSPGSASASASASTSSSSSSGTPTITGHNANNTMEEQLIKLITSTIAPQSWSEMGGPGTIDYFPLTMALVINQAADIQEQIADLLQALRRLQDQQVAVEVRLISLEEDFFERIGVNFNVNVLTNGTKFQPDLLNNSFVVDANRFINGFYPNNALLGITPAGSLTSDLNVPIGTQSFFSTVPQFGGYTAGGLTLGLAFLSDIQVFLFMEAIQGDQRANVMQAPKLTLFNGQTSTLTVTTTGAFVQGVQVVSLAGGAQLALVPQISPTSIGVTIAIQAVISADRRFVRMSIAPTLTNQVPGPITTFPLVVPIFTAFDGVQTGQPVLFTQFIQLPNFTTVTVSTTVAVPDGGTVLMGGLKRLSEARSEYGPPILSKVPYINRLFKNTGYGRETESLLILVTPRIIILEEEEERQTGFLRPPSAGGP